jgi:hypothetical protein
MKKGGLYTGERGMTWAHIEKPTVTQAQAQITMAAGGVPSGKVDDFDAYMQRLIQLIPAELVALYLAFHAASDPNGSFHWWWPIICLVLVVVVRIFGTRNPTGAFWSFQPIAVAVAAISFVLWIYAIGDKIAGVTFTAEPIWISAMIAIWTIVVPYFYKGS